MITAYNIGPTSHPKANASGALPFVRTIVFILRYKQLPYELVQIVFIDIKCVGREPGVTPIVIPGYKIHGPNHERLDHWESHIAQYLNEAYLVEEVVVRGGTRQAR
ncbi:hypothetical protein V5O48_011668, partial [Marasmius crinis-equi]